MWERNPRVRKIVERSEYCYSHTFLQISIGAKYSSSGWNFISNHELRKICPCIVFFCKYQPTKYYNPTWLQSHDRMAVTGSRSEVKHAQMLAWICLSARGYQENFCVLSSKWTKRNQRKATHFFGTRGHGPSVAQLGLLWALRREGHPSGAWRAYHTLLPCRPQDVWQGPSTDGRESVLWRSQTGLWICHG